MANFRYNGFAHRMFRGPDDKNPVAKGGVGNFSQDFVNRMTAAGHSFTKVDDLTANEADEAKSVKVDDAPVVDETRKPSAAKS